MQEFTQSLKGFSLPAVIRMSFALSGKTDDEVAAEMGWSDSVKNRICCNGDYWPSLPTLPKLCRVLGNTLIAQWITDNAEAVVERYAPANAHTLFADLRSVMREVPHVLDEGEKALADESISRAEARRILNELTRLYGVMGPMVARLQACLMEK